jgi:hypothetical protein
MYLNCKISKIMSFFFLIIVLVVSTGCIDNIRQNATETQFIPVITTTPTITSRPSESIAPIQNQSENPQVSMTPIITPHFYGTISYGSNRSSMLTEDQAWKYAEAFFLKAGITNIQASDVIPYGQSIWKDREGNQKMVWSFRVNRVKSDTSYGIGIITVDANDGHVIDFAGLD